MAQSASRIAIGVELIIRHDERDGDFGVDFVELGQLGDEPHGAHGHRGGDHQRAARTFAAIHQRGFGGFEFVGHFRDGAEKDFALLGEDEAARVAVEQGDAHLLFQRRDLAGNGGLAEIEHVTGAGEALRLGDGVENP